jgi:hypothetical protein
MSTLKITQWVSCLALVSLLASCSGMAGSPIQGDLDAAPSDGPMPQTQDGDKEVDFRPAFFDVFTADDFAGLSGNIPTQLGNLSAEDAKSASYTPGLACPIGGGVSFPSVLNYGWRNGVVTEGALMPNVHMISAAGTPISWIAYAYKEMAAGFLQKIKIEGSGKKLAVFMYNWNVPSWGYFGTYDLTAATPANIAVTPPYAPNGVTFVVLVQLPTAETTITRIQTDVF